MQCLNISGGGSACAIVDHVAKLGGERLGSRSHQCLMGHRRLDLGDDQPSPARRRRAIVCQLHSADRRAGAAQPLQPRLIGCRRLVFNLGAIEVLKACQHHLVQSHQTKREIDQHRRILNRTGHRTNRIQPARQRCDPSIWPTSARWFQTHDPTLGGRQTHRPPRIGAESAGA